MLLSHALSQMLLPLPLATGLRQALSFAATSTPSSAVLLAQRPRQSRYAVEENPPAQSTERGSSGRGVSFVAWALRDHVEGEEVFGSYGAKPNAFLMLNYGFVVEENVEPDGSSNNTRVLTLGLHRADPLVPAATSGDV